MKEVGVTDFGLEQLEELIDAGMPISIVQTEYSLLCRHWVEGVRHLPDEGQSFGFDVKGRHLAEGKTHSMRAQREERMHGAGMLSFCRHHGIKIIARGALGGGLLSEEYLGQHKPNAGVEMATPALNEYVQNIKGMGGWPVLQQLLRS